MLTALLLGALFCCGNLDVNGFTYNNEVKEKDYIDMDENDLVITTKSQITVGNDIKVNYKKYVGEGNGNSNAISIMEIITSYDDTLQVKFLYIDGIPKYIESDTEGKELLETLNSSKTMKDFQEKIEKYNTKYQRNIEGTYTVMGNESPIPDDLPEGDYSTSAKAVSDSRRHECRH